MLSGASRNLPFPWVPVDLAHCCFLAFPLYLNKFTHLSGAEKEENRRALQPQEEEEGRTGRGRERLRALGRLPSPSSYYLWTTLGWEKIKTSSAFGWLLPFWHGWWRVEVLAQGHLGSLLLGKLQLNIEKLRLYELITRLCLMSEGGHSHSLPHRSPICKIEVPGNLILKSHSRAESLHLNDSWLNWLRTINLVLRGHIYWQEALYVYYFTTGSDEG